MTGDRLQSPEARSGPAGAGEAPRWTQPLPPDSHVHSEWSWDALAGDMERTCERAVHLGLRSLAFTEHADFTRWPLDDAVQKGRGTFLDGTFLPRPLDVEGYLDSIERCRSRFPGLTIHTGVELGEAHLHATHVRALLASATFERRLGSLHSLPDARPGAAPEAYVAVRTAFGQREPLEVIRLYLAELERMVATDPPFDVLAHIDYPQRYWPGNAPAFDPTQLKDNYHQFLEVLAGTGRALEVNTRLPLMPIIVAWWRDVGGTGVTFASDAHNPERLAWAFRDAAAMAAAYGFRPGSPPEVWARG